LHMSGSCVLYTKAMKDALVVALGLAVAAGAGYWYLQHTAKPALGPNDPQPKTFSECAKYYPTLGSAPRTCINGVGITLTEDLGNTLSLRAYITVDSPKPNDTIASPLHIRGEAHTEWFRNEIEMPVEVMDGSGKVVGQGTVETNKYADSDKLLPFEGTVSFTRPGFGSTGTMQIVSRTGERLVLPINFK
jgi:hypothetical protein